MAFLYKTHLDDKGRMSLIPADPEKACGEQVAFGDALAYLYAHHYRLRLEAGGAYEPVIVAHGRCCGVDQFPDVESFLNNNHIVKTPGEVAVAYLLPKNAVLFSGEHTLASAWDTIRTLKRTRVPDAVHSAADAAALAASHKHPTLFVGTRVLSLVKLMRDLQPSLTTQQMAYTRAARSTAGLDNTLQRFRAPHHTASSKSLREEWRVARYGVMYLDDAHLFKNLDVVSRLFNTTPRHQRPQLALGVSYDAWTDNGAATKVVQFCQSLCEETILLNSPPTPRLASYTRNVADAYPGCAEIVRRVRMVRMVNEGLMGDTVAETLAAYHYRATPSVNDLEVSQLITVGECISERQQQLPLLEHAGE